MKSPMGSAQIGSRNGNITVEYLHLCETCASHVMGYYQGDLPNAHTPCAWCTQRPGTVIVEGRADDPVLAGFGTPEFKSSLGLMPWRPIIWDVNGYYRELGVDPRATRREIGEAYQRLNGPESERLTYIVKQLLDNEIRALYDATPLGRLWIDHYVAEWIRQARIRDAAEQRESEDMWENLVVEDGDEEPVETVVDIVTNARQDWLAKMAREANNLSRWGYYVWRTGRVTGTSVSQWQAAIAKALWDRGEVLDIAVGFFGPCMAQDWEVRPVGYRVVAFVSDDRLPNMEMAEAIADRVVQHIRSTEPQSRGAFQNV